VFDDGPRDTIEVLNSVGLEFIEHFLKTFDELGPRLSGEHVGRAKLCDDLGIYSNTAWSQLSKGGLVSKKNEQFVGAR
jgi:hypothetical protein